MREVQKGELQTQHGAGVHPCVVIKTVTALSDTLLSFGSRSMAVQQDSAAPSLLGQYVSVNHNTAGNKLLQCAAMSDAIHQKTGSDGLSSEMIDFRRPT